MENLMENLNKEQLAAVKHKKGPLLIVAGAGTGKTTVITQKIAYMIEQGWAKEHEILALTFTEKAAEEMEERVSNLLPIGFLELWISTFHSFGEKILREHGLEIGLPTDFKLLNEFQQYSLIKKNLDKFNLDYYRPLGNPTKFIRAFISHFSRAKDENISSQDYLDYAEELKQNLDVALSGVSAKSKKAIKKLSSFADANGNFSQEIAEQEVLRINEVANAYHVYQQLLLENSSLDFGDLINYTLNLFKKRPAILEKYRKQFKYILLDEFQDTNWAQYELIKILALPGNNLTVVGDDDQSIYKFRGASIANILQFQEDYPNAKQIFLNQNYRNAQDILDLSYNFIKLNNPNRLEYQLNKNKKNKLSKKLKSNQDEEAVIELIKGVDVNDEVRQVVEKIADLKIKDKQSSWSDFAILVRANDSAKDFCNALDVAGLPYQFLSSRGLYSKPVIMDVIAYFKLLDDYHESAAMTRILKLPIFDFSHRDLVDLNFSARKKSLSLFEMMKKANEISDSLYKKCNKVLNLINKHTALVKEHSVSEIMIAFLNDSGYLKYLMGLPDNQAKEQVGLLNYFYKRIQEFETNVEDKSIKNFLEELNMEIEAGEQGALPFDIESGPDAIKIMTIHAAKGLEFKYIFLPNMVDKRFPTIERKEPIIIPDDLVKEILPEGDIHLEEERRLFYVALTRAKTHIYFSYAPDYGGVRMKKPSRFLVECKLIKEDSSQMDQEKDKIKDLEKKKKNIFKVKAEDIKLPSYFSYTQLAAFKNCPYQYYLSHILRVPTLGKPVFSFGRTMHLALEKIFALVIEKRGLDQGNLFEDKKNQPKENKIKITWEEILKIYEESWIDDWYGGKQNLNEYKEKGKKILKDFYKKHKDNWPNAKFLEQSINLRIGGYRIYGKIDRIDDCGEKGIQIVDYKTGIPKQDGKLAIDDKEQLLIYQLAVQQTFSMPKPICNLQFYYLDNNSEVNFLGSEKELEEMETKILERIENIMEAARTSEFFPKPGLLCKFCDFQDICEYKKL